MKEKEEEDKEDQNKDEVGRETVSSSRSWKAVSKPLPQLLELRQ